ncbi:Cj0814 family flagellar-dependent secreted protein, partial [Campylobacter novaezeelandiae]|uniref:Cj0814 family flagellar-dependent secreted protein n=1 Tax=Campylobacter novaezeelandiae TaxID=2267891 RepID=UPI001F16E866
YKQADPLVNTSNIASLAYGYSVDKDGYMGEDFNKAAGLPEDFKIHKSTLDEIERFNQENMASETSGNYYNSFDMASIVKSYYNSFNQVISAFPNDKTNFSETDLEQLPKGLNYGRNENKEKIVKNIFNAEQFHEVQAIKYSTMNLGMNLIKLDFSPQSMKQGPSGEGGFNPDMSVYPQNEDGSYSKEALFMSFLKSYSPLPSPNQVVFSPEAKVLEAKFELERKTNPSFDVSLDDIMTGKVDFASLLKGYAQDGWLDAGIYAMEKGVKWQNVYVGSGISFDREFNQAKANGWKASNESIDSFVNSIMDRLNNLLGQTRV